MAIDNLLRNFLDCFSDHHKIKNDRVRGLAVFEQILVRYILCIRLNRNDSIINIREVEFHLSIRHR